MPIVSEAEKNQIMPVNQFASLCGHKIEPVLIFLCCHLWIDFTAHTQDRCFRDRGRREESFPGHSEVALSIIRRHAALISECNSRQPPREIMADYSKPGVNRCRGVST